MLRSDYEYAKVRNEGLCREVEQLRASLAEAEARADRLTHELNSSIRRERTLLDAAAMRSNVLDEAIALACRQRKEIADLEARLAAKEGQEPRRLQHDPLTTEG